MTPKSCRSWGILIKFKHLLTWWKIVKILIFHEAHIKLFNQRLGFVLHKEHSSHDYDFKLLRLNQVLNFFQNGSWTVSTSRWPCRSRTLSTSSRVDVMTTWECLRASKSYRLKTFSSRIQTPSGSTMSPQVIHFAVLMVLHNVIPTSKIFSHGDSVTYIDRVPYFHQ